MSHKASQQVLDSVLRGDSVNVYIHLQSVLPRIGHVVLNLYSTNLKVQILQPYLVFYEDIFVCLIVTNYSNGLYFA